MRVTQASRSEQVIRFMGTGGVLEVAGDGVSFTPQDAKDRGPGSFGRAMPREIRGDYEREWYEKNRPKPGEFETTSGTKRYVSPPNYSSLRDHFHHFFHSVPDAPDRHPKYHLRAPRRPGVPLGEPLLLP